jgi:hypothetical protein
MRGGVLRISSTFPSHPSVEDEAFRSEEDARRILLKKTAPDKKIEEG